MPVMEPVEEDIHDSAAVEVHIGGGIKVVAVFFLKEIVDAVHDVFVAADAFQFQDQLVVMGEEGEGKGEMFHGFELVVEMTLDGLLLEQVDDLGEIILQRSLLGHVVMVEGHPGEAGDLGNGGNLDFGQRRLVQKAHDGLADLHACKTITVCFLNIVL